MNGREGSARRIYPGVAAALAATSMPEYPGSGLVLLVPDPIRAAPSPLPLFTTGSALLRFARLEWLPVDLARAAWRRICRSYFCFFDVLRDWITTSGDGNSIQAEPDLSRALDGTIKELAAVGFAAAASERFLVLTGGRYAKPKRWRIVDIKVQPAVQLRITDPAPRES